MTAVVLMYHRVAAVRSDPYGLAVHPDRFRAHVDLLAGRGDVGWLEQVADPASPSGIAITFDDGYADNATVAAPVLAEAGLPATYFITTGTLGGRRFWWDRLADALLGGHRLPDGMDVVIDDRELWIALDDADARETALRFLHRRIRPLPPDRLAATVEDLLGRLQVPAPPDDELSMTAEQLRAMASSPLVQIGAHTRTHLQLRGQREQVQRGEVVGSVEDLRGLLGRDVTTFAYPFGSESAVGPLAPRLVEEAGCALAVSTRSAAVVRGDDRWTLPRLNVLDWPAEELARRIRDLT